MSGGNANMRRPTAEQRWIVGNGLPGVLPSREISLEGITASIDWAATNRLTGLLPGAAAGLVGKVPDEIALGNLTGQRRGLAVEVEACRAVTVLRSAGIDPVVFKGVAAAHLDYDDPVHRTFHDVDLLVSREAFADATGMLSRAGWSSIPSALGPKWEAQYARARQFVSPGGVEVDLHAALAAGYFGVRLDHDELCSATQSFRLGGVEMTCFDTDIRLLSSCYALVLSRGGNARLVRDIAQQVIGSGASWERAGKLAGDGDVVIAAALDITDEWIALPPAAIDWSRSVSKSAMQRCGLSLARRAESSGWRGDVAGELLGLAMRERLGYAGPIVGHRVQQLVRR